MSFNWSDPGAGQGQFTAAQAQSQFQPQQAQVGTIIAALLQQKYHQQELERQQQQDLIKGLGSVATGVGQSYAGGQADDSANAAMYGMQNPGDPYGGYTDPNRVPDYGGTDAIKAYLLQNKATPNPLDDQLTQAKIDAERARTAQTWSNYGSAGFDNGSTGGTSGYNPAAPETVTDERGREWRRGSGGQWFPMFNAAGAYRDIRKPNDEPPADFPDPVTSADEAAVSGQQTAPPPTPPGPATAPSVSQNDVNQVPQAPGNGPKPGEIRTVGGKNYTWDGQGWLPVQ